MTTDPTSTSLQEGVLSLLFADEEDKEKDEKKQARAEAVGVGIHVEAAAAPSTSRRTRHQARNKKDALRARQQRKDQKKKVSSCEKEDYERILTVVRACGLDFSERTDTEQGDMVETQVLTPYSGDPPTWRDEKTSNAKRSAQAEDANYPILIPGAYGEAPGHAPIRLPFVSSAGALLLHDNCTRIRVEETNPNTGGSSSGLEDESTVNSTDIVIDIEHHQDNNDAQDPPPSEDAAAAAAAAASNTDASSAGDNSLVHADPVDDEEEANLPVAEPQYRQQGQSNAETRFYLQEIRRERVFFSFVILAMVLALVFVTVMVRNGSTSASTETSSKEDKELQVLQLLPGSIQRQIENGDNNTPQNQAFRWLLEDPALETYEDWRLVQRFALAAFYHATGGPTNWRENAHWLDHDFHECEWWSRLSPGADMDARAANLNVSQLAFYQPSSGWDTIPHCGVEGKFQQLWLWRNGLQADHPLTLEFVAMLPFLQTISLYLNDFQGTHLPSQLGNLTDLEGLALNNMGLTGTLPTDLGLLTKMTTLILIKNSLTGSLPSEMGTMTELHILALDTNQLTGPIPSQLGQLTKLSSMIMFDNLLSSSLPTELGQLQLLGEMQLYENMLSGSIPSELGGGLLSLEELELDRNQLTGTIPSELGLLTNMEFLSLHTNPGLIGSIPTELGNLNAILEVLTLRGCQLSGPIPSQLGRLTKLTGLWLFDNLLSSSIPSELGQLGGALKILDLSNNHLNGTMPASIGRFTILGELRLHRNALTGPMPSELGAMNSLNLAFLQDNLLSGSIPEAVMRAPLLSTLNVSDNPLLSGLIPNGFCDMDSSKCEGHLGHDCGFVFDCNNSNLCGCDCPCA